MNKLGFSLLIAATLTAAGCTKGYITGEALEYNKALAQNMQEEILLNAVRASKRRPMSFIGIGDYTGTLNRNFDLTPSSLVRTADLGLSVRSALNNNAKFSNKNIDKFVSQLQQPVKEELFFHFINLKWPRFIIFPMFIRGATVKPDDMKYLYNVHDQCIKGIKFTDNSNGNKKRAACKDIIRMSSDEKCERRYNDLFNKEYRSEVKSFGQSLRTKCGYLGYKMLFHLIDYLRPMVGSVTARNNEGSASIKIPNLPGYTTEAQEITVKKGGKKGKFTFKKEATTKAVLITSPHPDSGIEQNPKRKQVKLVSEGSATGVDNIELELRSPEGMLYFLGQLISAQNYGPKQRRYNPKINIAFDRNEVELFDVHEGSSQNAIVSITDDEGQHFYIPKPNYGFKNEATSTSVLTLISTVIALQTTSDELPKSNTVTLTSN